MQSLPEDITRIVRSFADDLVSSLQESLKRVPQNLVLVKMKCKNINDTVFKNRPKVSYFKVLFQFTLLNFRTIADKNWILAQKFEIFVARFARKVVK